MFRCVKTNRATSGTKSEESRMPGVIRLTVDVPCERKVLMKLAAFVFLSTVACAMRKASLGTVQSSNSGT